MKMLRDRICTRAQKVMHLSSQTRLRLYSFWAIALLSILWGTLTPTVARAMKGVIDFHLKYVLLADLLHEAS